MKLYTAGVTDINYIDSKLPILFVIIQFLSNGRCSSGYLIDFAGHFKNTQWRSVAESIINLTVSLICVQFFGIYGVLLGTIMALIYRANDMIIYTHKHILHKSAKITYRRWGLSFAAFFICIFLIRKIIVNLDSYFKLFFYGAIYMVIILFIYILIQSIFEKKVFLNYWYYVKNIINRKNRNI
jgi:O-antigen/teichoic acid export membrane protein